MLVLKFFQMALESGSLQRDRTKFKTITSQLDVHRSRALQANPMAIPGRLIGPQVGKLASSQSE